MVSSEYVAGFVDGEGSLTLARIPRRGNSWEYCLRVSIANTDTEILEDIQRSFGGTLHSMGLRRPNWKSGYNLIWTNAAAAVFLRKVAPFLRVKAEQAALLLEFNNHLQNCPRRRDALGRLLPFSEQEHQTRKSFYWRARALNLRGARGATLQQHRREVRRLVERERGKIPREYLAGFIDAEGSLMIARTSGPNCRRSSYRARATVANTRKGILEQIQKRFGGTIHEDPRASSTWRRAFQLIWVSRQVGSLLSEVGPFLRVKRNQARVLSEFLRHVMETPRARTPDGRFFAPYPDHVIRRREELYQRLRWLNARGPRREANVQEGHVSPSVQ